MNLSSLFIFFNKIQRLFLKFSSIIIFLKTNKRIIGILSALGIILSGMGVYNNFSGFTGVDPISKYRPISSAKTENKPKYLKGKIYILSKQKNARFENLAISVLHNDDLVTPNKSGEFKIAISGSYSAGKTIDLLIKPDGWKMLSPFLGRMKLPLEFENNKINIQLIDSSQNLLQSKLFFKNINTYLQERKAKDFDPNNTSLEVSTYLKDISDYYRIPLKELAKELPIFADHVIENQELYQNDKELVAAAYYTKKQFDKAAPVYAENARDKLNEHYKKLSEIEYSARNTANAFLQGGDSFLSDGSPLKALREFSEANKLVDKNKDLFLWLDIKERQADAHGLAALMNSKGEQITNHLANGYSYYNEILTEIDKNTHSVYWGDINYKAAINRSILFILTNSPDKNKAILDAISYLNSTFDVFNKEEYGFEWARSKERMGFFLMMKYFAGGSNETKQLLEAKKSLESALTVFNEDYPHLRATILGTLIHIDAFFNPEKKIALNKLDQKIKLYEEAAVVYQKNNNAYLIQSNQISIADTFLERSKETEGKGSLKDLEKAIKRYYELLAKITPKRNSYQWFHVNTGLAEAHFRKSQLVNDDIKKAELKKSVSKYRQVMTENIFDNFYSRFKLNLQLAIALFDLGKVTHGAESVEVLLEAKTLFENIMHDKKQILSNSAPNYLALTTLHLARKETAKKKKSEYFLETINVYKSSILNAIANKNKDSELFYKRVIGQTYQEYAESTINNERVTLIDNAIQYYDSALLLTKEESETQVEIYSDLGKSYWWKATLVEEPVLNKYIIKASDYYSLVLSYYSKKNETMKVIEAQNALASLIMLRNEKQIDAKHAVKNIDKATSIIRSLIAISNKRQLPIFHTRLARYYFTKFKLVETENEKTLLLEEIKENIDEALKYHNEDTHPVKWAELQIDIAKVLIEKGNLLDDKNENKVGFYKKAINRYKLATKVFNQEENRVTWISLSENIAGIYNTLTFLIDDWELPFKESLRTLDSIINFIDQKNEKKRWIEIIKLKAKVYSDAGSRGIIDNKLKNYLEKSIELYKSVLKKYPNNDNSKEKADILILLADAQSQFQNYYSSPVIRSEYLNEAIKNYKASLYAYTKNDPYLWAKINEQIGSLFFELATKENYIKKHKRAIDSYSQALKIITEEKYPDDWVNMHFSLAFKYYLSLTIVDEKLLPSYIDKTEKEYKLLAKYYYKNNKEAWAQLFQVQIGDFYYLVGSLVRGDQKTKYYKKNIESYKKSFQIYSKDSYPLEYAKTNKNIGEAYLDLYQITEDHDKETYLEKAIGFFETGLAIKLTDSENEIYTVLQKNLVRAHKNYIDQTYDKTKRDHHLERAIKYAENFVKTLSPNKDLYIWVYSVSELAEFIKMRDGSESALGFYSVQLKSLTSDKAKAALLREKAKFLEILNKTTAAEETRIEADMLYPEDENGC